MKKYFFSFLSIACLVFVLSFHTASALSFPLTKSFGGKVYLAPIPGVTCEGTGKTALLSSNVKGLTKLIKSLFTTPSKKKALEKLSAVYSMIPVYTTSPQKVPKTLGQILGKEKLVPDLKTCQVDVFGGIPLPVLRTTDNYNVSKKAVEPLSTTPTSTPLSNSLAPRTSPNIP